MFAYINYLDDGTKDIVNVKDIKDFERTDFSTTRTYWIMRKGQFNTGQIFLLKYTKEEIENVLARGKRVRVPKLLDKDPPENQSSERKEAKDKASAQKASIEEGRQAFLMNIFKKRQALKRNQPIYPPHSTPKRRKCNVDDEISSESDDELIPQSKFKELEMKYKSLSRKYQDNVAEVKELRKLNVELQSCLVSKIRSENNTSGSPKSPVFIQPAPMTTGSSTSLDTIKTPQTSGSSTCLDTIKTPQTPGSSTSLDTIKTPDMPWSSTCLDTIKTPQTPDFKSAAVAYQTSGENQEVEIGKGLVISMEK
ncbi:uncharacterized protein [Misgurnus anguillicaudatus]|uniref:uncharacterized protein n=1 Tax=Misgurnus anguillicaudatus TaxID=75329 RepID=UPI003CCF7ECE